MAQDKGYDLNRFWSSSLEQRRNLAVTQLFEPGSIFKVFAGLAALEAGTVTVDDTFDGNDGIEISGHTMHNADNWSYGTVTFAEVIADSINTGMIRVALDLGADRLRRTLAAVGFGAKTGIELPGEAKGILRPAEQWSTLDLAASSIGQSVAVTGIQLARGLAVVANGGMLVVPHILRAVGEAPMDAPEPVRALSSASCDTMRDLMVGVVQRGTGKLAAIDGFTVAGKTGTAQKAVGGAGYVAGKYTSLFVGLLPAEDPEYVILVVLDEVTTAAVGGGSTAAPIFQSVALRWIQMGEIVPVAGL
jgi:cell division protein FtsI/penicillin-binding protein 2